MHEDGSPKHDNITENVLDNLIQNKVAKSAIAWVVLILLGAIVWKMAEPALPKKTNKNIGRDATGVISDPSKNGKSPKKEIPKNPNHGLGSIDLPSGTDKVQVIVSALNVRAEPSIKSNIVTTLSKGIVVRVLGGGSEWIKIRTAQGNVGYLKASPEFIRAAP